MNKIVHPYVKAIMEISREQNNSDWLNVMYVCSEFTDEKAKSFLNNKKYIDSQKIETIEEVIKKAGVKAPKYFSSFLKILCDNKRLPFLSDIASMFIEEKRKEEKILTAKVVSAKNLNDEAILNLKKSILEKNNEYYHDVNLTVVVDESLIAGITIQIGDQVIDSSIQGKLKKLSNILV